MEFTATKWFFYIALTFTLLCLLTYESTIERIPVEHEIVKSRIINKVVSVETKEIEVERPISLVFFHDPDTDYGKIGSVLLINSIMKYASEPENITFYIIVESESQLEASQDFIARIKAAFPQLNRAGGVQALVIKQNPRLDELFERVKNRNGLCRNRKIIMHHFSLSDTLPLGVNKVIVLDTDMIVRADITGLWEIISRQLDKNHVIAAHKNCQQLYYRYFKRIDRSQILVPDRRYATMHDQCTYDNGLTALHMGTPAVRNMLNTTLEMVMNDKIFNNMQFVACTRDMMNLIFAHQYGRKGIPSKWMLGKACFAGSSTVSSSSLVHFSGGRKIW
eukprot:CAMPEP_0184017698 /NCGR_PEP_ID=MMETSP0954-20121128/7698_1 /TAXON_ID=627963 /ORGANISM="Aplanochytrium sp, Strain PBS07" /LENGTH=334 /DNA_ID=CAMNT_0026298997 /DNA_START=11 /DNA_END=1012 /DNA_ORIENTATION=-